LFSLFNYRELVLTLLLRELKSRYRGSFFGYLWSLLNPLLLLAIYSFVFSFIFKPRIEGASPYALFLFIGLLPWNWFSQSLNESCISFQENSGILKKIYFPLEIIPLVKVLSSGIHFLFAFPIIILSLIFTNHFSSSFFFFPFSFFLHLLFTLFFSLIISVLGVYFKDLKDLLSNILHFLFFSTPIVYSLDMIPNSILKKVILFNPLTHLMRLWQFPLFYGKIPGYKSILYILILIFLLWFIYYFVFKKYQEEIVEKV